MTQKFDFKDVIKALNEIAGKRYRYTENHKLFIDRRIKEGYTLEDFRQVVENMKTLWSKDEKMERFLRPSTLFGNKMDGYLNLNVHVKSETQLDKFSKKASSWIKTRRTKDDYREDVSEGSSGIEGGGTSRAGRISNGGMVQRSPISEPERLPEGDS